MQKFEAYRHWERLLSFSFTTKWTNAVEQILLGNPQPAECTARKMAWMARLTPFPLAGFVADLFLRLGQYDLAIEWLEKAHKERAIRLVCAAVEPAFDPLRKYPRFNRLVAEIMGDAAPHPVEQKPDRAGINQQAKCLQPTKFLQNFTIENPSFGLCSSRRTL